MATGNRRLASAVIAASLAVAGCGTDAATEGNAAGDPEASAATTVDTRITVPGESDRLRAACETLNGIVDAGGATLSRGANSADAADIITVERWAPAVIEVFSAMENWSELRPELLDGVGILRSAYEAYLSTISGADAGADPADLDQVFDDAGEAAVAEFERFQREAERLGLDEDDSFFTPRGEVLASEYGCDSALENGLG